MKTHVQTERRTFTLDKLSEEEALALYSLVNLSESALRDKIKANNAHWCDLMQWDEAIATARSVRDQIIEMVDKR